MAEAGAGAGAGGVKDGGAGGQQGAGGGELGHGEERVERDADGTEQRLRLAAWPGDHRRLHHHHAGEAALRIALAAPGTDVWAFLSGDPRWADMLGAIAIGLSIECGFRAASWRTRSNQPRHGAKLRAQCPAQPPNGRARVEGVHAQLEARVDVGQRLAVGVVEMAADLGQQIGRAHV